ncbi:GNAT family N-acetyltransferase [Streptomyces meridianus]|uniref:GNAT family N-acetyltransferase n=1 Tax=Streptomyces meridianus TaxID=2938945 RepID=A0ABT0XC82_9ACTN|nr:GNAT family N-acetyltransferase [Streptomyces meridianus]MCM2579409.1 GNAT family N-acetyltransferase [Streptomyces meridianus]
MTGGPVAVRTATVPLEEIFPLRRDVLRPGGPEESARFPEDADPDVFHVAAYRPRAAAGEGRDPASGGPVLACITFFPDPLPAEAARAAGLPAGGPAARTAYRFRGMATAPEVRGQGCGRAVLEAGIAELRRRGVRAVWCNGRTPAAAFYERQGFTRAGEEFVLEPAGPHHVFVKDLAGRTRAPSPAP